MNIVIFSFNLKLKTMSLKKCFALVTIIFVPFFVGAQISPVNNKISINVATYPQNASFNYDSCFMLGYNMGMREIGLHLMWTDLETAPNTYNFTVINNANAFYPLFGMPVDLNIDPIETNNKEVPSDLSSLTFDSPTMIARYKKLLDSVKAHAPVLTLSSLIIGSQSDVYLNTNATLWTQYTTFYNTVATYARTLWPGLKVASELTFYGLKTFYSAAQTLNTYSDYIGVSYYPVNIDYTVKPISVIPKDTIRIWLPYQCYLRRLTIASKTIYGPNLRQLGCPCFQNTHDQLQLPPRP